MGQISRRQIDQLARYNQPIGFCVKKLMIVHAVSCAAIGLFALIWSA